MALLLEELPCDIIFSILSLVSHTRDITALCFTSKPLRLRVSHLMEKSTLQDKLAAGLLKQPEWVLSMDRARYYRRVLRCGRDELTKLSNHVLISALGVGAYGIYIHYAANVTLTGPGYRMFHFEYESSDSEWISRNISSDRYLREFFLESVRSEKEWSDGDSFLLHKTSVAFKYIIADNPLYGIRKKESERDLYALCISVITARSFRVVLYTGYQFNWKDILETETWKNRITDINWLRSLTFTAKRERANPLSNHSFLRARIE